MKEENITVVISCDDNFIVPTAVMLKSLEINTHSKVDIYFLDSGISNNSKSYLLQNFEAGNIEIRFVKIDPERFKGMKISERIPLHTYYRLLIPGLLPEHIEKIIYLDGDIIVRSDIKELWDIELNDKALLAVREMWIGTQYISSEKGIVSYRELNIPAENYYFNAGVLVINTKKWRDKNYTDKILGYLERYREAVVFHDQDGLNAVLWDDWGQLPEVWNVMGTVFAENRDICCLSDHVYETVRKYPKIVHFSGPFKPWNDNCDIPYKYEYYEYLKYLKNI